MKTSVPSRNTMQETRVAIAQVIATPLKVEARKLGMTTKALTALIITQYLNSKGVIV